MHSRRCLERTVLERQSRGGTKLSSWDARNFNQTYWPIISMKLSRWFTHSNKLLSPLRIAIAGALVVASGTMAFVASKTSTVSKAPATRAFVLKKERDKEFKPGDNARALFGPNESRAADYTP